MIRAAGFHVNTQRPHPASKVRANEAAVEMGGMTKTPKTPEKPKLDEDEILRRVLNTPPQPRMQKPKNSRPSAGKQSKKRLARG